MSDYLQVISTAGQQEEAQAIAQELVARRLAACVQVVGPITSTYWWNDKIETAQEWQCIAKTRHGLFHQVEQAIRAVHSYETPEIIAVPIVAGHRPYLDWMDSQLGSHSP